MYCHFIAVPDLHERTYSSRYYPKFEAVLLLILFIFYMTWKSPVLSKRKGYRMHINEWMDFCLGNGYSAGMRSSKQGLNKAYAEWCWASSSRFLSLYSSWNFTSTYLSSIRRMIYERIWCMTWYCAICVLMCLFVVPLCLGRRIWYLQLKTLFSYNIRELGFRYRNFSNDNWAQQVCIPSQWIYASHFSPFSMLFMVSFKYPHSLDLTP